MKNDYIERYPLLEYLKRQCECEYLSDLRYSLYYTRLQCILPEIPAEYYPPSEWADALYYMIGQVPKDLDSAENLKKQLIEGLIEQQNI